MGDDSGEDYPFSDDSAGQNLDEGKRRFVLSMVVIKVRVGAEIKVKGSWRLKVDSH